MDRLGVSLLRTVGLLLLDSLVDLLPMYGNLRRGFDPEANLVSTNIYNRHDYIVADYDALITLPGQDKHQWLLPWRISPY